MSQVKSLCYLICIALLAGVCCAAEGDAEKAKPKGKPKAPNVLELVKPVDELIDKARDIVVDGDSKKAITLYRDAMDKITDIEMENFEWVKAPEFAPVRSRRVLCLNAVNRIMLEEAQAHSRTMTVTDTTELEKKRAERRKAAQANPDEVSAPIRLSMKGSDSVADEEDDDIDDAWADVDADAATEKPASGRASKPAEIAGELELAKDFIMLERFDDAERMLIKALRADGENRLARFLMAQLRMQQERYTDALVCLDGLIADDPKDEASLLLAAGAHMAAGAYSKSCDALEKVMKLNPKRPDTCINMAWLLLAWRPGDTSQAETYYRFAVKLGAARERELEKRLGIKQE